MANKQFTMFLRTKSINWNIFIYRCISSRRRKEEIIIPDAAKLSEPWNERKELWKSTFAFFESKKPTFGPDFIRLAQTPLDLSSSNVRKWYKRRKEDQEEYNQAFVPERLNILGPDLAAAHFIVHRGGAIRFYKEKDWVQRNEDNTYTLPRHHVFGLHIEAIDCKNFILRRAGLENILDLPKLRWLSLADNPLVDDWTLDSVSGSYGEILEYLDISNCTKVSHRALSCFYRFQKLRTLVVSGLSHSSEFKLSCLMLEDLKPHLTIQGIDYSKPKLEDNQPELKVKKESKQE